MHLKDPLIKFYLTKSVITRKIKDQTTLIKTLLIIDPEIEIEIGTREIITIKMTVAFLVVVEVTLMMNRGRTFRVDTNRMEEDLYHTPVWFAPTHTVGLNDKKKKNIGVKPMTSIMMPFSNVWPMK